MALSPNCGSKVHQEAEECLACGAFFGQGADWQPVEHRVAEAPSGSSKQLLSKVIATGVMVYGILLAFGAAVVITTLVLPVGLERSPFRGAVFLSLVYLPLAIAAIAKCWRSSAFHPLVVAAAIPPVVLEVFRVVYLLR